MLVFVFELEGAFCMAVATIAATIFAMVSSVIVDIPVELVPELPSSDLAAAAALFAVCISWTLSLTWSMFASCASI